MDDPLHSRSSTASRTSRELGSDSERSASLANLKELFAQFRSKHARGPRVPRDLRAATLAALRLGVTAGEVSRTCGVSKSQLDLWRAGADSAAAEIDARSLPEVRAFSVVDGTPDGRAPPAPRPDDALELRWGRWTIRIRLDESSGGI